jgi:hypothetical protein
LPCCAGRLVDACARAAARWGSGRSARPAALGGLSQRRALCAAGADRSVLHHAALGAVLDRGGATRGPRAWSWTLSPASCWGWPRWSRRKPDPRAATAAHRLAARACAWRGCPAWWGRGW